MAWWNTTAPLTPLVAWDASTYSGDGTLTDMVAGVNTITKVGGLSTPYGYKSFEGTGRLMPFVTEVSMDGSKTIVVLAKPTSSFILFYGGTKTQYILHQESSGGSYGTAGASASGLRGGGGAAWNQWQFLALVKRPANVGVYVNGEWTSETGYAVGSVPTTLGGLGYQDDASGYNLGASERIAGLGVFTGAATLTELRAIEAAMRAELAGGAPVAMDMPVQAFRGVMHPLALLPGKPPTVSHRELITLLSKMNPSLTGKLGTIEGTTTIENIPGSRRVRLFDKATAFLVAETWSSPVGHYEFNNLDTTREYFAVAHDHLRVYNGVIQDMLQP